MGIYDEKEKPRILKISLDYDEYMWQNADQSLLEKFNHHGWRHKDLSLITR